MRFCLSIVVISVEPIRVAAAGIHYGIRLRSARLVMKRRDFIAALAVAPALPAAANHEQGAARPAARPLTVTLLGTGTPAPSLTRQSSGYLIEVGDDVIVWDHGPGAHQRLIESGRRSIDVTHAFFTHLHYDHCMDYVRLVLQRWDQGAGRIRSEEHTSELQSSCKLVCRLLLETKNMSLRIL